MQPTIVRHAGSEQAKRALLLTGAPGVGKTTVIRRVATLLAGERLRGLYTEEMRVGGERQGFRLITFDGLECIMAHVNLPKTSRVGKYGIDVRALDEAASKALRFDSQAYVYLVDEIGKMECLSEKFVSAVCALLTSGQPVVATVARKGAGLIAEVKQRPECVLWEVTRGNRDQIPAAIVTWLRTGMATQP